MTNFAAKLRNGIRTRPVRRLTQGELDSFLEKAADILRGNVDHSEFRGYVFALLFFKRISDVYLEEVRILTKKLGDIEAERQAALKDIHEAYDPVIEPLPELKEELAQLEAADFAKWSEAPDKNDLNFGSLKSLLDEVANLETQAGKKSGDEMREAKEKLQAAKTELRAKTKEAKDRIKERTAEVKRAVKELTKLDEERTERLAEINAHADRHVAQVKEAAADLARICADPEQAKRCFVLAERPEIEENEFNLNMPRFVDTFDPEEEIPVDMAVTEMREALKGSKKVLGALQTSLSKSGIKFEF